MDRKAWRVLCGYSQSVIYGHKTKNLTKKKKKPYSIAVQIIKTSLRPIYQSYSHFNEPINHSQGD